MNQRSRIVTCVAFAAATPILYLVARYLIAQPISVFRTLTYLYVPWGAFVLWVPLVALVFTAAWLGTFRWRRGALVTSLSVLFVSVALFYGVQYQPLESWLLPPATVK